MANTRNKLLDKFFKKVNIKTYKYLAIDILLTIFCNNEKKLLRLNKFLTDKFELNESVDKDFIGFKGEAINS